MSMPNELFYPIGVIPCVMVFEAHIPHDSEKETWFGYWKDDGFVKTKHEGRIDKNNEWSNIENQWLDHYKNKRVIDGKCVCKNVIAKDEWVAEAYMETDYSKINNDDFIQTMKEYTVFKIKNDY